MKILFYSCFFFLEEILGKALAGTRLENEVVGVSFV